MQAGQQEQYVSEAFSRQSPVFDAIDDANKTIGWMRERVRAELVQHIHPGASMLELNSGTGIDAIFFAQKGFKVLATDNAQGMLQELDKKRDALGLHNKLQTQRCSFNELEQLFGHKFDYIFSNFGGLNCSPDLGKILRDVDQLLNPGGYFSFVIMPVVCPWEMLMLFKGYFKTAFRRFGKHGTSAHLEGVHFQCYYYDPSYVVKHTPANYKLVSLKGLSITVPPPFIEGFIDKHPKLFSKLEHIENKIWTKAPYNRWCDHYIITMQKPLHG
jgi:ubiquinone/menaquinone biosynthesis C-methylase UbiE